MKNEDKNKKPGKGAISKEQADAIAMTRPMKNAKASISAPSKFNINLLCGDCLHYKGNPHPRFDSSCIKLGIGAKSEAPSCYTPDVTAFRSLSRDTFAVIAALVAAMTPRQSRVLLGTLKYAGSLEKIGMSFLEECYFSLGSTTEAYLDDYVKGYVIGLNKGGGVIVVGTDYLQGSHNSMIAYLDTKSILTEKKFNALRVKLVALGKIRKPKVIHLVKKGQYEVPTIDEAPTGNASGKRRKKSTGDDRSITVNT